MVPQSSPREREPRGVKGEAKAGLKRSRRRCWPGEDGRRRGVGSSCSWACGAGELTHRLYGWDKAARVENNGWMVSESDESHRNGGNQETMVDGKRIGWSGNAPFFFAPACRFPGPGIMTRALFSFVSTTHSNSIFLNFLTNLPS